jgi:hypothetical protein
MNGLFNKPRTKLITDILQNNFDVKQFIASNKLAPELTEEQESQKLFMQLFSAAILLMNQGCMIMVIKAVRRGVATDYRLTLRRLKREARRRLKNLSKT